MTSLKSFLSAFAFTSLLVACGDPTGPAPDDPTPDAPIEEANAQRVFELPNRP